MRSVFCAVMILLVGGLAAPAAQPVAPPPQLLSPEPGALLDNGRRDRTDTLRWRFEWSAVPGAQQYQLQVGREQIEPSIDLETPQTAYTFVTNNYVLDSNRRDWRWRVRAQAGGTWSPWSAWRAFEVERLDTDPPTGAATAPSRTHLEVTPPVPLLFTVIFTVLTALVLLAVIRILRAAFRTGHGRDLGLIDAPWRRGTCEPLPPGLQLRFSLSLPSRYAVPVLAVGLLFFLVLGVLALRERSWDAGIGALASMGILLLGAAWLLRAEEVLEIDTEAGTYTREYSWRFAPRRERGPVSDFCRVVLSVDTVGREDTATWPVYLEEQDGRRIEVQRCHDHHAAQGQAEGLAHRLGVTLFDETGMPARHFRADAGKDPLAGHDALPPAPPGLRTSCSACHGVLQLLLPAAPAPRLAVAVLPLTVCLIPFAVVMYVLAASDPLGPVRSLILGGCGLLFLLLLWVGALISRALLRPMAPVRITVTQDDVRVYVIVATGAQLVGAIPRESITAVTVEPPQGRIGAPIAIRGRETTLRCAGHLPDEEKAWVIDILRRVLRSQQTS